MGGIVLGYLVSAAIVVAATMGWLRWRLLDLGGRWVVGSLTVSVLFIPVALWGLYALGETRRINEVAMLLETCLFGIAFAAWQPTPRRSRVVRLVIGLFVVYWIAAQLIQGAGAQFSYLSGPVASLVRVALAGYTLLGRVPATRERWTDQLWFWAAIAVMVISGTGVILDPVWMQVFRVRNDLVLAMFGIYVVGNVIGYGLIARGLWSLRRPVTA